MIAAVTGANGFLGRALVRRLLERGMAEVVRCLVRSDDAAQALRAALVGQPLARMEPLVGAFSDRGLVGRALEGADVLFHLAASPRGAAADIFLNTVVASQRLLDGLKGAGLRPRTVLVSSFGVYGVAGVPRGAVIDETTPVEPHPERRDHYSHAKLRQEQLFREFAEQEKLPLTVVRPGSIYGPGGNVLPARVGLRVPGIFLALGGGNPLPLSFVDNCADALIAVASSRDAIGKTYNVHDDGLPSCRRYLRRYRSEVEPLRMLPLPYPLTVGFAHALVWYNRKSKGQLPAFLTPYRVASIWKPQRFDNSSLKATGWAAAVSTEEGMSRTFAWARSRLAAPFR